MPDQCLRLTPRIVKRAISKHQARGPNINRRSYRPPSTSTSSPQPTLDSSAPDANYMALRLVGHDLHLWMPLGLRCLVVGRP